MDLQEIRCLGMDCIDVAQDADKCQIVVYAVMKLCVP